MFNSMHEPSIPIVCTLLPSETGQRLEEFEKLFTNHLREVSQPSPRQARFGFEVTEETEAVVRELFAREQKCCAFFDFVIQRRGARLIVQAQVPAGAEAVLDEFATVARRAAPRAAA